ncbi:condensation domain-containing protein [Curtobacterium flaccumfaciens pv. flaccumfaciens]
MVEQFFAWDLAVPDHFNQDLLMEIGVGARRATIEQVAAALSAVWYHHDALRAVVRADRLHLRDVAEAGAFPLESVETSADGLDGVLQQGGDRLHRGLDLVAGPLARALLVSTPHRQCLVIVAHHLVVDLVSWQVIAEDLRTALDQAVAGEDITLPAKTASLREWADALEVFTTHRATETDTHWSAVHRALPGADLRVEMPTPETPAASARTEAFVLDAAATTAIVDDGTRAYSCSVEDLALTALGEAARRLTSQERLSVRLESHGRLEHDMLPPVDRTVGWFTSAYPVVLETTGGPDATRAADEGTRPRGPRPRCRLLGGSSCCRPSRRDAHAELHRVGRGPGCRAGQHGRHAVGGGQPGVRRGLGRRRRRG